MYDRQFSVTFFDKKSNLKTPSVGLSQGEILSLTLHIIYINEIPKFLKSIWHSSLFILNFQYV